MKYGPVKTKDEFLARLRSIGACRAARDYVAEHESGSARDIWETCEHMDWHTFYLWNIESKRAAAMVAKRAGGKPDRCSCIACNEELLSRAELRFFYRRSLVKVDSTIEENEARLRKAGLIP